MSYSVQFIIRLLVAGLFGALIGYERELRAKGAGVRTHVLVALGAALFMIISQHGFEGAPRFDAARVAAGVVSGIGFLGGGIIMKKNHISGLTTAAGLWVTAAIGLGCGSGLYVYAGLCTLIVLICLEALNYYDFKFGLKEATAVLSSTSDESLIKAMESLGKQVEHFIIQRQDGSYRMTLEMRVSKKESGVALARRLKALPDVTLEGLE